MFDRPSLLAALFAVLVAMPAQPASASTGSGKNADFSETCRDAIARIEREKAIPVGILHAISRAESGRWDAGNQASSAWPWTVTARGQGRFYPTRKAAIEAVRKLQRQGVSNIDVGCMQINLHHHPDAFDSLEEAFDPEVNAAYAAALFSRLRKANRSITRAIAHYHSTTRRYNLPYTRKVVRFWNEERRRIFEERRLQLLADWKRRKSAERSGQAR